MAISAEYRAFLADLFSGIGHITFKRFFGLDGISVDGVMLGFAVDETVYLRTDAQTRPLYEAEHSKPFTYGKKNGEAVVTGYYTLPERLYDEPDELESWARRAYDAARQSPSAQKKTRHARARSGAGTQVPAPPAAGVVFVWIGFIHPLFRHCPFARCRYELSGQPISSREKWVAGMKRAMTKRVWK